MAGSTFGKKFKVMTWGESHGQALGVVIDGCPAGLMLNEDDIQKYLDLRKPIYKKTAAYGHFGREEFPWEKTDMVKTLKKYLKN